jgi:hypothetical protein
MILKKGQQILENFIVRIKLSILWIFIAVAASAHAILYFMEPGAIEELKEMVIGPGMMLFMALFWLIPLVMAFLSLTLKDIANKRINLVIGGIFTILNIGHLFEHLVQPSVHQLLIVGSTVVVSILIIWYAWKWT